MFDVVIVDEASQAGLEATFLQYLAPKIVVIGDDKQVSPSAVGVDQQQLRDLGNQYLYDDRYRASWQDPQRSLFDEAKMRFGGMLTLVEHRRCVPEIIGFSNRIAYEPDGVRLIPVRQFGADRLEPIRTVFVEDGYERGASTSSTNPPEVDAIVDQIEKCLADPRYDGLTFGVISLLGTTQAKAIEKKLLDRISPEEWTARDLRCGDAADFQGSERDVMFLSMVAAPQPDRRLAALTQNLYVQRYNVAASRAKDQMWLFHSVDPATLTNTEDMRFQLLDYCYGVQKRARPTTTGSFWRPSARTCWSALRVAVRAARLQPTRRPRLQRHPTVPRPGLQPRSRRGGRQDPAGGRVRRRRMARTGRIPARHGPAARAGTLRLAFFPGARVGVLPGPGQGARSALGTARGPRYPYGRMDRARRPAHGASHNQAGSRR